MKQRIAQALIGVLTISFFTVNFIAASHTPSEVLFLAHFDGNTKEETDGDTGSSSGLSYGSAKFGQGAAFDNSDFLKYSVAGNIKPKKGTIEFWYKPSYSWSAQGLFDMLFIYDNDDQVFGWVDYIAAYGTTTVGKTQLLIEMAVDSAGVLQTLKSTASKTWNVGEPHHIAVTWDSNTFRLYTDGTLEDEITSPILLDVSKNTLFIGNDMFVGDYSARGTIDEFIVWDHARSASQVSQDSNKSSAFYPGTHPPSIVPQQPKPSSEPSLKGNEKPKISLDKVLPIYRTKKIVITGEVTSNVAVSKVEYSLDRIGYSKATITKSEQGGRKIFFKITIPNLGDGNYRILVRVSDVSGNKGLFLSPSFVVDTLPPIVGGNLVSIGPQILQPNEDGVVQSLVGVGQKITVASVGGPTRVYITAKKINDTNAGQTFTLKKSIESGLWSVILNFSEPGVYELKIVSVDGAGNKLVRRLNTVSVSDSSKLLNEGNSEPIQNATVTLYYLEREMDTWTVWDGVSYGLENPQETNASGEFNLFIPPGKYYLKVQASGFRTLISNIFEIDKPTPMVADLLMKESFKLNLGLISVPLPLPLFSTTKINFKSDITKPPEKSTTKSLQDKRLPPFDLPSTSGEKVNSTDLLGKPTLISFVTTWSPAAREQFPALSILQKNKDIDIIPISTLESSAKVKVYAKLAGYDLDLLIDKNGTTVDKFSLQTVPTHFFVDRKGVIKKVVVGILSRQELLDNLAGL